MLEDLTHQLRTEYRSGRDSLLGDFYIPCLNESVSYDRAVGYFRSSLLQLVAVAYSDFVRRGGRMRLICSPAMTPEDYRAVVEGLSLSQTSQSQVRADLERMLDDPESLPGTKLLATLVASGNLQVKIAFPESADGIFHTKIGIFQDLAGRRVSFVGSANETFAAWGLNHESFEVFASWQSETDLLRTRNHAAYFERLWSNTEPGVATEPLDRVTEDRLRSVADDDLSKSVDRVRAGPARTQRRGHAPKQLLGYQLAVLEDWERHGHRGIVAFATGAGKTITAIEALRRWTSTGRPALVLVPGRDLHRQWREELRREFPEARVLLCGSGHGSAEWAEMLPLFSRPTRQGDPRIILATNSTFTSHDFRGRLRGADGNLLLVADEMHRAGSSQTLKALEEVPFGGTLGLSATYSRQFDEQGTRRLMQIFGEPLDPVIGLAEALALKRLVPYDYRLHTVTLEPDEQERYEQLTGRIRTLSARTQDKDMPELLKMLLIQRARVLKQARAKAPRAVELLANEYTEDSRWLVYCDDQKQLREVVTLGVEAELPILEYHSNMRGDRGAVLDSFAAYGGIVVAIRCLDEGVDIPACDKALILASSTVEREYIQRRGRVLRIAEGKLSAEVNDLLLVDERGGALTRGEAVRAIEFARLARNPGAEAQLKLLLALSPDTLGASFDELLEGEIQEGSVDDD